MSDLTQTDGRTGPPPHLIAYPAPPAPPLPSPYPRFARITVDFHEFIGDSWVILFSHPADFTPVCTTELGAVSKLSAEFAKRNVKTIGLSCNELGDHDKWIADINVGRFGRVIDRSDVRC